MMQSGVAPLWGEWRGEREQKQEVEKREGRERKREFAERKHFSQREEKQLWKLHQKKTKTRGRTKEVPRNDHKELVHFFSVLSL